jgi:histidine ammonia-lyase
MEPIPLGPKEGLGLINGTQFIVAYSVLFNEKFRHLLDLADIIGALSLEGLQGSARPFMKRLHDLRPFKGNQLSAARLKAFLKGSDILKSHESCDRVQDPYSFRCMPAVHGASRNAWNHINEMLETELNSVTDNPILFDDGESVSGGNFHGQPLAIPMDYGAMAAAELGSISERRSYLLLEGKYGLSPMLIAKAGINSGFMIPQYTAAALVTENKTRCFPASVDSIPTGMGQEDHVSMGSISARKAWEVVQNLEHIFSIELLYAVQAIDFRRPRRSSDFLESIHAFIREHVSHVENDRVFSEDMAILHHLISEDVLINFASQKMEELGIEIILEG